MAAFDVRRRQKERDSGLSGHYISCHYLPGLALGLSYVTESIAAPVLFLEAMWKLLMSVTCTVSSWDGKGPAGKTTKSKDSSYESFETKREKSGEEIGKKSGSSTEVSLMTLPFCSQKLWACTWERVMCQEKLLCVRNVQIQSHHRFHFSLILILSGAFLNAFVKKEEKSLLLTIATFHSEGNWLSAVPVSLVCFLTRYCNCMW